MKQTSRNQDPPSDIHESEYAKKKREQAAGTRPPFKFKDRKLPPRKETPLPADSAAITVVTGVVTVTFFQKGYCFLTTPEGHSVYVTTKLSTMFLTEHGLDPHITRQCVIECSVVEFKNRLKATKIHSITFPNRVARKRALATSPPP